MTTGITRAGHFVYKNELYKIAAYDYLKASKIAKHEAPPFHSSRRRMWSTMQHQWIATLFLFRYRRQRCDHQSGRSNLYDEEQIPWCLWHHRTTKQHDSQRRYYGRYGQQPALHQIRWRCAFQCEGQCGDELAHPASAGTIRNGTTWENRNWQFTQNAENNLSGKGISRVEFTYYITSSIARLLKEVLWRRSRTSCNSSSGWCRWKS